jgi:D-3-phosphoglycerate dehydrogenase
MAARILVTDYAWPSLDVERQILADLPGELVVAQTGEESELVRLAPQADAILSCWKRVSAGVIDAAPNCRIIARYGVGLDNIDVDRATARGIPVTNVPTFCVDEVTDHALALLFALTRRVVRFDRAIRGGSYPGLSFQGIPRIAELTLGLLGYGNIGRAMGRKARALGMRILAFDPAVSALPPEEGRAVGMDALLAESDVVSIHAPLLPTTRELISDLAINGMKSGAYLINTARGGIVDLDAVLRGLQTGRLAGAALDVFPQEPPDLGHPIFQHPRFIATPHTAFYSEASVRDLQAIAARQVLACLRGERPPHIVNPDFEKHSPRVKFN